MKPKFDVTYCDSSEIDLLYDKKSLIKLKIQLD